MKHPHYGNVPHVYYHKRSNRYYVRFKRRGRYYFSRYYKTIEEAIKARNDMQYLVPPSESRKHGRAKICDYTQPTWIYEEWLKGNEEDPKAKPITNVKQSPKGVVRYFNRKQYLQAVKDGLIEVKGDISDSRLRK